MIMLHAWLPGAPNEPGYYYLALEDGRLILCHVFINNNIWIAAPLSGIGIAELENLKVSRFADATQAVTHDRLDILIFCPKCKVQHIDVPTETWDNRPHHNHLCHNCRHIFPVTTVKGIETNGADI